MGMRIGPIIDGVVVAMAVTAPMAHAQAGRAAVSDRLISGHLVMISSPGSSSAFPIPAGEIVREIDDPHLGYRWLLVRDDSHPGGPARLVMASAARGSGLEARQGTPQADAPPPVIRAGDRVILEEHTSIVDAHLEAVAMAPAWAGSAFDARLSIGGRVVRAVASGPGRAIFQEETRP
jgi:hypothetical protein